MRFGVLGPLAVWTDEGALVAVPGVKVRALLADLLLNEGRPVPADRLIDDLWGEALPGNPAGALSAKVSQLRRVLEDAEAGARGLVVSRPAGYALESAAVDAVRFQALVAGGSDLAEALALWRGPAFADFADESFTQATIARLEESRLVTLEEHAEARLALGEHGGLVGELAEVLDVHPLRERLRAAHMRALYRAGRQSEALASYERLRVRLADELGLDPGPELVALQRDVLAQDPGLDVRPRTNLGVPPTGLIGRDEAVAQVGERLEDDRLVTLTGPGGVGKTRLALAVAGGVSGRFGDGVWLVELAGFERSAGVVADAVMRVLDVRDGHGPVIERLAGAMAGRRLLLVLDNCEHLVEQVAGLAGALLGAVPGLRVLATSREPLGLPGEAVWSVPPLEIPDAVVTDPDVLARSSAVRLFVARASDASRDFRLDAGSAEAVAVLCRRLDGIPLALELAATRVRALGVDGLVARLDDRFRLLATGYRGAPHRQRTLTAMIDWSWELLSEPERAVLCRLAVHADGCSLEAAEAVCAGEGDVLDLLVRLVDRSLVVMGDGPRYRLLESVAAYCVDRLVERGEYEAVLERHRDHYTGFAERADARLRGDGQARWLRLVDAEAANLRVAFDGAVAGGDAGRALRAANALTWYWYLRGRLAEAWRSLTAALDLDGGPPAARARASAWLAGITLLRGDEVDWPARRDAALRFLEEAGEPGDEARGRWFLAFAGMETDDIGSGERQLDRAMEAFESLGDRWGTAAGHILRATHAHMRGRPDVLERESERAARLFGELGDGWGRLQAAEWLAAQAELTGEYERADRLHREGLRLAEELHLWPDVAIRWAWLSWISLHRGLYAQAREYASRVLAMAAEWGDQPATVFADLVLGLTARREGDLDGAEARLQALLKSISRDAQPPPFLPLVLVGLGYVAELRGDVGEALELHADALDVAVRIDGPRDTVFALEGLAGALGAAGHPAVAARFLGAAAAVRRSSRLAPGAAERDDIDRAAARARAALGEDGFAAAYEGGGALTPAECLAGVPRPAAGDPPRR